MDWDDHKQIFFNQERDYFEEQEQNELQQKQKKQETLEKMKEEFLYLQLINQFPLLPCWSDVD